MVQRFGYEEIQQYAHLKDFVPFLKKRGTVVVLRDAQREVKPIHSFLEYVGHPYLYIYFSPPDPPYSRIACPKMFIAPIDKDQLPPFSIEGLQGSLAGLSFCPESIDILQEKNQGKSLLECVPPPIWDEFQQLYDKDDLTKSKVYTIDTNGNIIDTKLPDLQPAFESFKIPLTSQLRSIPHAIRYLKPDTLSLILSLGKRRQFRYYSTKIELSGIVYTTLINPRRRHKNWKQLVLAFSEAFEKIKDATLVIKVAGIVEQRTQKAVIRLIRKLSIQCRIILIFCHLNRDQYEELIRSTTYVINASSTKVVGSSLLEFMSAGKPTISPALGPGTPLTEENAFLTDGMATSLKAQLEQSYDLAKNRPDQYRSMSKNAMDALQSYCSIASVEPRFQALMDALEAKLS